MNKSINSIRSFKLSSDNVCNCEITGVNFSRYKLEGD